MTYTSGINSGAPLVSPGEQRTILHNVRWATYEQLLADLASQSSIRLAYNRGTLEIMTPLAEHERLKRRVELLIEILAAELKIEIGSLGSTTFKRADLERGFEPDSCFYVQNELRVRDKRSLEMSIDPPPDLIIEIDITRDSMNKFPIYAQIGVPEVWRHDGIDLRFYKRTGEDYALSNDSLAFPGVTNAQVCDVLSRTMGLPSTKVWEVLQEWARTVSKQG